MFGITVNEDFRKGAWMTLGAIAVFYVVGVATGLLKRIV